MNMFIVTLVFENDSVLRLASSQLAAFGSRCSLHAGCKVDGRNNLAMIQKVLPRSLHVKCAQKASAIATGLILLLCLCSCSEKKEEAVEQVRGLRAYKVAATAESRVRRFPSILQPADLSRLSFEIAGQVKAVTLEAGQKVQLGDVLAEIDPRSLQTQVEQASAGVREAQAQLDNADADFQRQDQLLKKGVTT